MQRVGMMLNLEGVYSVLPTPFTSTDEVSETSLKRIIDLFLEDGVHGFTALGVTSEAARLTDVEKQKIANLVLQHVAGRVPVVVGTTSEGTHTCIEQSHAAIRAGASALMVSPPRMPKLNSEAVVGHFRKLSESIDAPIVIQDYPPISGFAMEPSLLIRIANEIPNVIAIKLEDAPTPLKIAKIREMGSRIPVFGGLGGMYLLEELMAGANGAMTGFAFPKILIDVIHYFQNGELEQAKDVFYKNVALMRFEFQEGIGMAIRKEILRRRGVLENASVRAPGPNLDSSTTRALDELLRWFHF
jgi:4-hydroxy-tetrahydrodipicolinate synthase